MNGYAGTAAPPAMYVRALYDYAADDRTSLSFRQGEIIQVINQLESGWWDGVINGVRGWFPSNYCAVINDDEDGANRHEEGMGADTEDELREELDETEFDEIESINQSREALARIAHGHDDTRRPVDPAAYWIPQATPDGRLFYFNTMTGVSTMELPLEAPTSDHDTGPRDRINVYMPETSRPPPEMLARGLEHEEDEYTSASDAEPMSAIEGSTNGLPFRRPHSSAATEPRHQNRGMQGSEYNHPSYSMLKSTMPPNGPSSTSFAANPAGPPGQLVMAQQYFDEPSAVMLTWDRLIDDMRRSVQRYREAIRNADRAEFVRRAEDISDHMRLVLAAGSGTTDNHSGNPSIISSNKALYPHFRETMSRFSKLVLSSHIAAADFPPPDSYAKCLKEAEGVLNGVYSFVEVARQQRGEIIPRLIPGFVPNSHLGGNWRNHGVASQGGPVNVPFLEQDDQEMFQEPNVLLDFAIIDRLEELKRMITEGIKRIDEQLQVHEKLISPMRHKNISDRVCHAATRALDLYRPWFATIESLTLAHIPPETRAPYLNDLSMQKQTTYDHVADLIIACQEVAAPLADEWAEIRGSPLDTRLKAASSVCRELIYGTSEMSNLLKRLSQLMPHQPPAPAKDGFRKIDSGVSYDPRLRGMSTRERSDTTAQPGVNGMAAYSAGDNSKLKKFFGEVPTSMIQQPASEDVPEFLRLEHEGELMYDMKASPPQLKGGTLPALVELLTRHDRLDSPFNNTFLLTYTSFTSGPELFEMLANRWKIQPSYGLREEDYQVWVEKKQKPIRFRVVNILKTWFDSYWMEGNSEEAKQLIQKVYNFAKEHVSPTNTPGAAPLIAAIEQRMRGQEIQKRYVLTLGTSTPAPILPKNMKKLKFLDIDPLEMARQLTIIESKLYVKITPTECLHKTWQNRVGADDPDPAPNIKGVIVHSNHLTGWVASMILKQNDVKRRVVVIKHFVAIAEKCRTLNNFSTLTSILSALGTAPIYRLSRTWAQVKGRTLENLEAIRGLMASTRNFWEYRENLHRSNPPCIPFLGVYLTDLTFIEDGIPSILKRTSLINFAKRAKTAEVIRDIQQYQNAPYPLQPVPELQEYIQNNLKTAEDVHNMYELSLQVEPREREDEKIARLLSESGFL